MAWSYGRRIFLGAEVASTRIWVTNTDGSSHVEEIVEWEPDRRLRLAMRDFTPLSRLATGFGETCEFERHDGGTRVVRSFRMYPKLLLARPVPGWSRCC